MLTLAIYLYAAGLVDQAKCMGTFAISAFAIVLLPPRIKVIADGHSIKDCDYRPSLIFSSFKMLLAC